MPSSWTSIPKPTGQGYTKVNANGLQTFDDPLVDFDDAFVCFDGGDGNDWNNIAKPIGSSWTKISKPTT